VLKNNILRARGFLLRKSLKYKAKWTFCFFYIDINQFVTEGLKILKSFRAVNKIVDREFMEMFDMKRTKVNENIHMLLIPFPTVTVNGSQSARNNKE
jgi:hypothetical protein